MTFKTNIATIFNRLCRCMNRWWSQSHSNTAAALAFFSLVSMVPILLTGIWIASIWVGEGVAKESLVDGAEGIAGENVSGYFNQLLSMDINVFNVGSSKLSPFFALLFALYTATQVLTKLRLALGGIFGSNKHVGKRRILAKAMTRAVSIALLIFLGLMIAGAVMMETVMTVVANTTLDSDTWSKASVYASPVFTFVSVVIISATAMKWLPERSPSFKHALMGGIVTAIILAIMKVIISLFLKHADVGSYYGSSLALVIVLFWVYFAMQAFLFGAEYTAELRRESRAQRQQKEQEQNDLAAIIAASEATSKDKNSDLASPDQEKDNNAIPETEAPEKNATITNNPEETNSKEATDPNVTSIDNDVPTEATTDGSEINIAIEPETIDGTTSSSSSDQVSESKVS